jgi:intracellular sulfur oxidation DsrE/DsrF family protein
MPMLRLFLVSALLLLPLGVPAAEGDGPWGAAKLEKIEYTDQKVVYDVAANSAKALNNVLDRVSYLSTLNGANPLSTSIVVVLHGDEIPFFAIKNYPRYKDLMVRAQSLSVGDVIRFEMCAQAAKARGFEAKDIHGFVTMVPMADAEIVRLQQKEGYAYMR